MALLLINIFKNVYEGTNGFNGDLKNLKGFKVA